MPQLDMIGMVVTDMATTLRFYRTLGLDIPAEADQESHVEFHSAGYRMAWDTRSVVQSFDPDWAPPEGPQRAMGLAFLCESPAEVDRVYQHLTHAGYPGKKAPWDAFWGQRYAQVTDPDCNPVDLFCPLTGA